MYVVAGATGHTGSVVAQTLLDAKEKVRVIVRDAAKGEPWRKRGAEVAVGDVLDAKSLATAFRGARGAYLLVPPPPFDATGVLERARRIADVIVEAVRDSSLQQVVLLSSIAADKAEGTGPIRGLHYAEDRLGTLKVPSTFLRAAYFQENWASSLQAVFDKGELPSFLSPADRKFPMVATWDIGATAAQLLLEPPKTRRVVELAGREDYSVNDVAAVLSRILGRTIKPAVYPTSALVPVFTGMGASAELAGLYQEMTEGMNNDVVTWSEATQVRGTRTIEDTLRQLTAGRAATSSQPTTHA